MAITLEKPSGLPVFPPHADPSGDCVLRRLLAGQPERGEQGWPPGFEGGIAHRLDISTSGALLCADTPEELASIRQAFSKGVLTKTYRLLVAKDVPWDTNVCERAIANDRRKRGRMIVQRGPSTPHRGKWYPAHTRFRRIKGRLFEAVITTGVMHQIRVHAAFVGIPLEGDRRYGGGAPEAERPDLAPFRLHHVGLSGAGLHTTPFTLPTWAKGA
jgi:23S rRNA pseudouridine1911/1915/1917 synthase